MELFDTHVHLNDAQFAADRAAAIDRARAAGVSRLIEIADAPADWEAAITLSRAHPALRCSLGLHPYYAAEFSEDVVKNLGLKIGLPEVVAVGEIGLDYVKSDVPRPTQLKTFEALLAAAKGWDIPVVIHCRGAYDDLIPLLAGLFPSPPAGRRFWGVVHCFSSGTEHALACARLGFALGADGPVTYPKNDVLRAAFQAAGPGVAVLETDSPYLPPQSARGKRNEPALLPEVARRLAAVYGLDPEELARITAENGRALYRLK